MNKLEERYQKRNGLWNLEDCRLLDNEKIQKEEFISIMIDYDFWGTEFGILNKEECLEVRCKPDNYGKVFKKEKE